MARRKGDGNSKDVRGRRRKAWEKQGGECWLCHQLLPFEEATIDHVIPWSIGGTSSMDNIRVAHEKCNNKRQDFGMQKEELWYWAWVSYERGWRNSKPKCPKPTRIELNSTPGKIKYGYIVNTGEQTIPGKMSSLTTLPIGAGETGSGSREMYVDVPLIRQQILDFVMSITKRS